MKKKVAILVNSCDLYEDAWEPFFKLFQIQWPGCPYDIYLNTENKKYIYHHLNVKTIATGSEGMWTERIKKALNEIDADDILFMLEDFFLLEEVDSSKLETIIAEFQKADDVGFVFFPPRGVKYDLQYNTSCSFTDVNRYANYRVNACLGLWRKEFLLQMLYFDGSPWEFEHNATRLSWLSKYRCCVINPEYSSIFSYSFLYAEGYGISYRKWLPKNKELFEKYNISVNFDNLGFFEYKPDSIDKGSQKRKNKNQVVFLKKVQKKAQKHKKRLKKQFRYLKDLLFVKSAFGRYCRTINKK